MSLEDFRNRETELKSVFTPSTDKADFTLIDRESTKNGSPVVVSFDLPFKSVAQATLKTSLIAGESFLGNEFKLASLTLNGKRFEVSDVRNSVNLVDKANDTALNKVLKPFNNVLSVSFSAPIGAGLVLPDGEISAILTVFGERDPFSTANLPNATQLTKKAGKIKDQIVGIGLVALIAIIIIGLVIISMRGFNPLK